MSFSDFQALSPAADSVSHRVCRSVAVAAGIYAITGGLFTLVGWVFDLPRLTDWNNDGISMFPNTALCAILGGAVLILLVSQQGAQRSQFVARMLATFVAMLGGLTLLQHIIEIDLGIDRLLIDKPWGQRASAAPMRMGPPASVSFLLLGCALVLATLREESRRFASELGLLVVSIASLSLIGYWFGADKLFGVAKITGIALQTSTILTVLGIGLTAAVPEHGIVAATRRDDAGGTVLRRLIVPIILIPLLLGWLRIVGQNAGLYDLEFGTALRTMAEVVLLFGLLWWTANGISQHARAAREAEESLKAADRRKDEFLATLAHELRNPLAPIGNALSLINHADSDSSTLQLAHETIERQFGQMVRLVDDLLDIGRITRDRLELRPQPVELAGIIQQAIEICRTQSENKALTVHVTVPTDPMRVHGDPVRLVQVFSNLCNNACKFTEPGGRISISAAPQAGEVVVTVADTGIGIAPEQLPRIFEMFEQADKRLERTQGGLGIGLTLAKRLVELHGGQIDARSEGLGGGSQFIVRLPLLAEEETPDPVVARPPTTSATGRRILIADDNRDAANSLAKLLKIGGHEVQTAYDGLEAVEKVEGSKPDLILLDIGMPGMNGHEVCRFIRQQPWGKDIRIVALTGWGQENDRRQTQEAGFDQHLVKPVLPEALNDVLRATS